MNIIIVEHARRRMIRRGASEEEIKEALEKGQELEAKKGRKAKDIIFPFMFNMVSGKNDYENNL